MLSGITLNFDKSLYEHFKSDFKNIFLFYIFCTFVISILSYFFNVLGRNVAYESWYDIGNYTYYIVTRNSHQNALFLVAWFLIALIFAKYIALLVFKIANKFTSKPDYIVFTFSILLGFVSINYLSVLYLSDKNQIINIICQCLVGFMFLMTGRTIKNLNIHLSGDMSFILSFVFYALMILVNSEAMVMSWSAYPSGFIRHFTSAVLGSLSILMLAHTLRSINIMELIGERSKHIMAWHITAFVLLDLIFIWIGKFHPEINADIFVRYKINTWWPVYTIAGIAIPIFMIMFVENIKKKRVWKIN